MAQVEHILQTTQRAEMILPRTQSLELELGSSAPSKPTSLQPSAGRTHTPLPALGGAASVSPACSGVGGLQTPSPGQAQAHLFFSIFRKSTSSFLRSRKGRGMSLSLTWGSQRLLCRNPGEGLERGPVVHGRPQGFRKEPPPVGW